MFKRILKVVAILLVVVVVLFVTFIGPWPTYKDSHYKDSAYFSKALADITEHAKASDLTATPDRLQAGWAKRGINPGVGTPLAGYSGRNPKESTGARDEVECSALALSDGKDTVVLIGSDMLIIPPNLSEGVRARVAEDTGGKLSGDDILFNASHTHCGPGGFGPGLASAFSAGSYDPKIPEFLIKQFSEAILEAYKNLAPAALAYGHLDAPEYIRNRAGRTETDSILNYMVVKHDDGKSAYVVRYSAHPTTFSSDQMEMSAEYPGELKRYIEAQTGQTAEYLGGAVGAMGPRAPEGGSASDRVKAMGEALAKKVLDATKPENLKFSDHLDIASVGVTLGMPQQQLRPIENKPGLRLSPFALGIAGVPKEGWISGVKVGDLLFMGMPCDFGGGISNKWRKWAEAQHLELWTHSFCSTYCGYFSPDEVYDNVPLGYETGAMSWYGPNVEAYFTDLFHHTAQTLVPAKQ